MKQKFSINLLEQNQGVNPHLPLCQAFSKPIALMPAGQQAINFSKYLLEHGIVPEIFIDNNPAKHGKSYNTIPVCSFEEFLTQADKYHAVIVTNTTIAERLCTQLKKAGVSSHGISKIDADYQGYSADEFDNAYELIEGRIHDYAYIFDFLEDDLSRKTFINVLNYRINQNKRHLKEISRPASRQYFEPDIYSVSKNDSFVDCGSFDGDTLQSLMQLTQNKIQSCYCFEPDIQNYRKCKQAANRYQNVYCFNKGVYKENTFLYIDMNGNSSSRFGNYGDSTVETVSLDTALKDKKVTFIKMDVEGAEYDALIGAKDIIVSQKPVLAICLYHRFFDIVDLPLLVRSFGINYRFFLRHYTDHSAETVLYTIFSAKTENSYD